MHFYLEYTLIFVNLNWLSIIRNNVKYFITVRFNKWQENAYLFGIYPLFCYSKLTFYN